MDREPVLYLLVFMSSSSRSFTFSWSSLSMSIGLGHDAVLWTDPAPSRLNRIIFGLSSTMSIEDIRNYMAISDRLASSGQPEEMQFKDIAQAGFELVINLAMPNSEYAIPDEGYIVTARGMMYVHLAVPFEAPTAEHLRSFIAVMGAFEGKKCWVHCVVNYRASAFLYQYLRLVRNLQPESARKAIFADWQPDQVWRDFMALSRKDVGL